MKEECTCTCPADANYSHSHYGCQWTPHHIPQAAKWLISKRYSLNGPVWFIWPPYSIKTATRFNSGAEAIAAFARGSK